MLIPLTIECIGNPRLPLSTEFAIREAVKLLIASRRHFKSRHIEQARTLLEMVLAQLPPRKLNI